MLFSVFLALVSSYSHASLEPCGKVSFGSTMSCEKPDVRFNVRDCEEGAADSQGPTKISCEKGDMIALLKTKSNTFRVIFTKNSAGNWEQKGQVWRFTSQKTAKSTAAAVFVPVQSEKAVESTALPPLPLKIEAEKKAENHAEASHAEATKEKPVEAAHNAHENAVPEKKPEVAEEKPAVNAAHESVAVVPAVIATPLVLPSPSNVEETWKFKFSGWLIGEHESFENFGDGVTTQFSNSDPYSRQQDTNLLANFQFNATKGTVMFQSILEVGEVFFGDSSTGGNQGLRKNNIEVRNLFVQEEFTKDWFFQLGLLSFSSDPRGFILADHYAGAMLRHEADGVASNLWYADATDSKPGTTANKDSYLGLNYDQKYNKKDSFSGFAVYRSTRESFVDTDTVTSLANGKSEYAWLGANSISKDLGGLNLEINAIVSQSKFTATTGQTDSNMGWLAHFKLDADAGDGWNFALDGLGTSGANDSRSGTSQVLGKRKNFASPNPSSAYLLTVVTNDGNDLAPGSLLQPANVIGRLDLDEGLRLFIATINKTFGEKIETYIRYGKINSSVKRLSTGSDDFGSEIDLHLSYKSTANTSWILDWGSFMPGSFFASKDTANLTSLKYKLDF